MNLRELLESSKLETLQEGKIGKIAAVMALSAALAHANPSFTKVGKEDWQHKSYGQKIEFVKELDQFKRSSNFGDDMAFKLDMNVLKKHLAPDLMVNRLDSYYVVKKEAADTPVWLAMMMIEGRIKPIEADRLIYKNKWDKVFHKDQEE